MEPTTSVSHAQDLFDTINKGDTDGVAKMLKDNPKLAAYIADLGNLRVRAVGTDGNINTVAGSGSPRFSGDNGPATQAKTASVGLASCTIRGSQPACRNASTICVRSSGRS